MGVQVQPNLDVEGAETRSSSSESTQLWFDSFTLHEDGGAAAARARAEVSRPRMHRLPFIDADHQDGHLIYAHIPCGLSASAMRLGCRQMRLLQRMSMQRSMLGLSRARRGRRVWGPKPPPQHAARLCAELVLAAVGQADGRTLVAQVYTTLPYL